MKTNTQPRALAPAGLIAAAGAATALAIQPFVTPVDLAAINEDTGFTFIGASNYDDSGYAATSAGDINGDGFEDIIIGAAGAVGAGTYGCAGEAYVIFGEPGLSFDMPQSLASLNGDNGFTIRGEEDYDHLGASIAAAGDVNGDDIDDIIIGARAVDGDGPLETNLGAAYVIFGAADIGDSGVLDVSALDGDNGFRIEISESYAYAGTAVASAGDLNGDGVSDLAVSAPQADVGDDEFAGAVYILFGAANIGASGSISLDTLAAPSGFRVEGAFEYANLGQALASGGDIDGDGFDELLIDRYVVRGAADLHTSADFNTLALNGPDGFAITGIISGYASETALASGDVNADGFSDIILGDNDVTIGMRYSAGETYVIFGSPTLGDSGAFNITTLDGANGFRIQGAEQYDRSGSAVAAGDINGDGFSDVITGAPRAEEPGSFLSGESYVILGAKDVGNSGTIDLDDPDSVPDAFVFAITGAADYDYSGEAVGAADINGDGLEDVIIGARKADTPGMYDNGRTAILFGAPTAIPGDLNDDCIVNSFDISICIGAWGPCPIVRTDDCLADLNGDGDVNATDLATLIGNWSP